MKKIRWSAAVLFLGACASMFGGGFWLQFGTAEASPEALSKNAALVVKPVGCHDPGSAKVTGTAEGIVDGKRVSQPLTLVALSEKGAYAVMKTWPSEGQWVLTFSAKIENAETGAIAHVASGQFVRKGAVFVMHAPTKEEVDGALRQQS